MFGCGVMVPCAGTRRRVIGSVPSGTLFRNSAVETVNTEQSRNTLEMDIITAANIYKLKVYYRFIAPS
jgi:hypothetical protein